jgi:myosin heavy subunit
MSDNKAGISGRLGGLGGMGMAIGAVLSSLFYWKMSNKISSLEKRDREQRLRRSTFGSSSEDEEDESIRVAREDVPRYITNRRKEINDRLDTYETRVTLLEKKMSAHSSHERRIGGLETRISEMGDHEQRMFQIEKKVNDLTAEIAELDRGHVENANDVKELKAKEEDHSDRLAKLEVDKPMYSFFPGNTNLTESITDLSQRPNTPSRNPSRNPHENRPLHLSFSDISTFDHTGSINHQLDPFSALEDEPEFESEPELEKIDQSTTPSPATVESK